MQVETEIFWVDIFVLMYNYRKWIESQKEDSVVGKFSS